MKSLRGIEYSHLPHENDNIVDLFNTVVHLEKTLTESKNAIQEKTRRLASKCYSQVKKFNNQMKPLLRD